jgi:hypothetical protein
LSATQKRTITSSLARRAQWRGWERGKTLVQLAEERQVPRHMTSGFVLAELGHGKKAVKQYVQDPSLAPTPRLRTELEDVLAEDFIYSPRGITCQKDRGIFCESCIKSWLDEQGITYMTEQDSREMGRSKTPDFLFHEPHELLGREFQWMESKGEQRFAFQARHDYEKQLSSYVELFGPGIVVYWVGFVDDIVLDEDVAIVDRTFFD